MAAIAGDVDVAGELSIDNPSSLVGVGTDRSVVDVRAIAGAVLAKVDAVTRGEAGELLLERADEATFAGDLAGELVDAPEHQLREPLVAVELPAAVVDRRLGREKLPAELGELVRGVVELPHSSSG